MRAKSLKINVKDAKSTSELLNLGIEFDRILKAHYSDSPQKPEFRFFLLNKDVKVKDYMHPDTFDGYKVPLKYRVLNRDGSDKETGILHFQVIRPVKGILDELIRLRKIDENVKYGIEVKVLANVEGSGKLIEKGSEILLRPQ